jgi:hypothetical protein
VAKPPPLQPMARLPKEPAAEMLRSFGPRPSLENLSVPTGPIASPSPSAYREKNPYQAPPTEYKAPSLLREHRRLALLFAGVAAAFAVYALKSPHATGSASVAPIAAPLRADAAATHSTSTAPSGAAATPTVRAQPLDPAASVARRAAAEPSTSATQPIYVESVPEKESH